MEKLLEGGALHTEIDEQIVFNQLDEQENAVWSLLDHGQIIQIRKYGFLAHTGNSCHNGPLQIRIAFKCCIEPGGKADPRRKQRCQADNGKASGRRSASYGDFAHTGNSCHNGPLQIRIAFKCCIEQASGKCHKLFPITAHICLLQRRIVLIQQNQKKDIKAYREPTQ